MAAGTISSEKIDLLIYGPLQADPRERLFRPVRAAQGRNRRRSRAADAGGREKIRGMAVTYHTVRADKAVAVAAFPSSRSSPASASATTTSMPPTPREHNIVVTNTPDVLTEEVADVAMGLLISTLREFVKADRYLRSGLWQTQNYPLSVGSLRDRKVGIVGMGRIGQAIARRLDASRVPVVYHSRKPAADVSYKHYPDLIEMAKAVDTLIVIVPGGASTAQDDQCRGAEGARAARRPHQRRARLGGRRAGADRGAEVRHHPRRRSRRVRRRADRAGRAQDHAERRAAAAYRLGFGGDAQRHGSARGRQPQDLVRRQAAADAGCGNAGEGALMSGSFGSLHCRSRRCVGRDRHRRDAQDATTLKKDMIGQWELSTTERSKTCVVTLKGDAAAQGFKLELEPGCAAALPFTKDIAAWSVKGLDIVRLQDATGEAVIDFTEVEAGIFEGLRQGEGVYILQNLAAARSLAKSMDQMIGDWSMVRGNGQPICGLTLTNTEAGPDNFQVFLKPKCDPAIAPVRADAMAARARPDHPDVEDAARPGSSRPTTTRNGGGCPIAPIP